MRTYELYTEQYLKSSLNEAWVFFTSPQNLSKITPAELGFKITSRLENIPVYSGMEISYTVKPLFGIKVRWKTRISEVVDKCRFTDLQLEGPYALWEHTHSFRQTDQGLLMTDLVKYRLPYGILGKFVHWLFVRKKIEEIFEFRKMTLEKLFNHHVPAH